MLLRHSVPRRLQPCALRAPGADDAHWLQDALLPRGRRLRLVHAPAQAEGVVSGASQNL